MSDELWLAVIQAAAAILTPTIGLLVALIAATVRKKYALDVTEKQEAQLTHAAQEAVRVVEELAAAKLKAQRGAMLPAEKFTTAVASVMEKLPNAARAEIERKVIAALPIEGAGALANPPQAPESK